ncbi:hypothetical protein [Streptomyces scabiei]|uniref:hypothetical protein n=1 Tax=Streptomyces scabiei TaxID=1930 RepID=UPI0029BAC10C|nr:hypothetical protein [Streptomyces scabiei]MDX3524681.1 hypothetical protein [Streptomyces scabiei]
MRRTRTDGVRADDPARRTAGGGVTRPAAPPAPAHAPETPGDPAAARGARAARLRSPHRSSSAPSAPRPRVEVTLNELTGTMSWRTLDRAAPASGALDGTPRTPFRRAPGTAPWSARAAALRSAGADPSRAPATGAAPIPTHPAAVRSALSVDVAALTPEAGRSHLARLGALRSEAAAGLAHGTGMPASRLRSSSATPAHTHALTARHASAATRPPGSAPARPRTPDAPAHRPGR